MFDSVTARCLKDGDANQAHITSIPPWCLPSWEEDKDYLRSMGQEKVVDRFIVPELEVPGLDSGIYWDMADLFTQQRMPVVS